MGRIETLTAYHCKFSYLLRNNPKIEEQRELIKEGKSPEFSFREFMELYKTYTTNVAVGENTDRAIMLEDSKVSFIEEKGLTIWHITPSAGKQGSPITLVKPKSNKRYAFGADSVALYDHQIFVYESSDDLIAIFHRQNGSGCKSVFLETANKALKEKGYKLEMDLIVPMKEDIQNVLPSKITLQYTRQEVSTDDADNMKGTTKKHIIRELGLNLEDTENKGILEVFKRMQLGKISKDQAFVEMKAQLSDSEVYDDAEIQLKIGKGKKRVQWGELENIIGTHDITLRLHEAYGRTNDFVGELAKLSKEYYEEIINSEEV